MNKLLNNKYFLIGLGIIAVLGLIFITINATQNIPESSPAPTQTPLQPKTATLLPPVKDKPVTGQIIVKFKPQYTQAQINDHLKQYNASIIKTIEGINQTVVKVPAGQEETIMKQLQSDPYVETTQRDYTTHAFLAPNDPGFPLQYAFNNTGQTINGNVGKAMADIRAEAAWDITKGDGVKVAILDTGIDLNQPDLTGKVVLQKSFVSNTVEDGFGHGTHVAGILAANTNNGIGVAGTCPDCQLMIGKVLDDTGSGTTSNATAGITWAADNGAKVISMSLGTTDPSTESLYAQAVSYAMSKGAIVVAAAGNDSNSVPNYPAAVPGVVSVAATTSTDQKASFSNFGSYVEIAAPGDDILSTGPTYPFDNELEPQGYSFSSPYFYASGTSMATPMVSGVAALIASTSFGTTPQALINRLYSTADKIAGTGTLWTNGRVDAAAAVGPAPTTAPAPTTSLITPTIFCFGGNGTPPCATIPPAASPTVAIGSPASSNGGNSTTPSTTAPTIAASVSGTPAPTITGTPATTEPCVNLALSSTTSSTSVVTAQAHKKHGKIHHHSNGNLSNFFNFLLQLLLQLLQLIGLIQCPTTTPTPTPTPTPAISITPTVSMAPTTTVSTAPSSTAPTTTNNPSPSSSVTSTSCTNPIFTSSDALGIYSAGNNSFVYNNEWNSDHGPQTLNVCSTSNWNVVSTQPATTDVKVYPDVQQNFNSVPISSFKTISSTFTESGPTSGSIYEAAYDIWTPNNANEIMIWVDNHGQVPAGSVVATATIDGATYRVYKADSTISFENSTNITSGTINILAFFNWLTTNGYLTNPLLHQIGFGWEIASTNNQAMDFKVTNYSLTTN